MFESDYILFIFGAEKLINDEKSCCIWRSCVGCFTKR